MEDLKRFLAWYEINGDKKIQLKRNLGYAAFAIGSGAVLFYIGLGVYGAVTEPDERVIAEYDINGDGVQDRVVERPHMGHRTSWPFVYSEMRPENDYGVVIDGETFFVPEKFLRTGNKD